MPRSGRRLCRAPFYCLKQIARAKRPTFRRGLSAAAHLLLRSTRNYSLTSRKTVAFARMSGGNGAQLQAAFYAACLKRSLPTRCHSEPPRMRRVEESTQAAEKWLQCNHARAPIHKHYCHPARSFDFVPCYSLGTSLRITECPTFTRPAQSGVCRRGNYSSAGAAGASNFFI